MANIQSQIKRNRQNEKRRLRNKSVRAEMRTRSKSAVTAAEAGAEDSAEALRLAREAHRQGCGARHHPQEHGGQPQVPVGAADQRDRGGRRRGVSGSRRPVVAERSGTAGGAPAESSSSPWRNWRVQNRLEADSGLDPLGGEGASAVRRPNALGGTKVNDPRTGIRRSQRGRASGNAAPPFAEREEDGGSESSAHSAVCQ